jgi:hypothetical protein
VLYTISAKASILILFLVKMNFRLIALLARYREADEEIPVQNTELV